MSQVRGASDGGAQHFTATAVEAGRNHDRRASDIFMLFDPISDFRVTKIRHHLHATAVCYEYRFAKADLFERTALMGKCRLTRRVQALMHDLENVTIIHKEEMQEAHNKNMALESENAELKSQIRRLMFKVDKLTVGDAPVTTAVTHRDNICGAPVMTPLTHP
jgi:hypothetical protein